MTRSNGSGQYQVAVTGARTENVPRDQLFAADEALPPRVRKRLNECDYRINPVGVLREYRRGLSEDLLIKLIDAQELRMKENERRYYQAEAERIERENPVPRRRVPRNSS